jgi:hypothetical protein
VRIKSAGHIPMENDPEEVAGALAGLLRVEVTIAETAHFTVPGARKITPQRLTAWLGISDSNFDDQR